MPLRGVFQIASENAKFINHNESVEHFIRLGYPREKALHIITTFPKKITTALHSLKK